MLKNVGCSSRRPGLQEKKIATGSRLRLACRAGGFLYLSGEEELEERSHSVTATAFFCPPCHEESFSLKLSPLNPLAPRVLVNHPCSALSTNRYETGPRHRKVIYFFSSLNLWGP